MSKQRQYFGTDGIRGKANQYPMTIDVMQALGSAIVEWLQKEGHTQPTLIVGRDTRRSGQVLEAAFSAGVCAMGGHIVQVGVVPTPAVAWLTQSMNASLGVVLSASHNPYQDNGIKLFAADGYKLSDAQELYIEHVLETRLNGTKEYPNAEQIGSLTVDTEAKDRYLEHLLTLWPDTLSLQDTTIVVDGAHGAAYKLGPALFQKLGAKVIELGNAPDGLNINEQSGALHPEALKAHILASGASLGIALDGDADRLIVVDETGHVVDGDQIMTICATHLHQQDKLPHATVVATVMSNLGMERTLARRGIQLERTQVGDRYVIQRMKEIGATVGGEQSGHMIFSDCGTTGDGLVAALQLLQVLAHETKSLSTLAAEIERYPQILKNVYVREKKPWKDIPQLVQIIEQSEQKLGQEGRVFVRYSGTENKARVMVEGADAELIEQLATEIADVFQECLGI